MGQESTSRPWFGRRNRASQIKTRQGFSPPLAARAGKSVLNPLEAGHPIRRVNAIGRKPTHID
jgi:hypothetical protein